jgi:hypothetical protein
VGLSRISNSISENGKRGTTRVRSGINNKMMTGNPTAAGATRCNRETMGQFGKLDVNTSKSESRRTDGLSDRKCRAKGDKLYGDEEKDARLAHAAKWFIIWCHRTVREEIKYFCGNAVSGNFIKAHVPAEIADQHSILEIHAQKADSVDTYNKPASTPAT